jgi:Flp pilus assembly protein TadG
MLLPSLPTQPRSLLALTRAGSPSCHLSPCQAKLSRKGAAATEFALVALTFFTVIMGIFELGRALMVRHLLTNAARQACRVGVLQGKSSSQISAVAVNALTAQGINGDTVTVQVNDATTDASTAPSGAEITVIVSIPMSSVSWLPSSSYVINNLSGQYTLRRE